MMSPVHLIIRINKRLPVLFPRELFSLLIAVFHLIWESPEKTLCTELYLSAPNLYSLLGGTHLRAVVEIVCYGLVIRFQVQGHRAYGWRGY